MSPSFSEMGTTLNDIFGGHTTVINTRLVCLHFECIAFFPNCITSKSKIGPNFAIFYPLVKTRGEMGEVSKS